MDSASHPTTPPPSISTPPPLTSAPPVEPSTTLSTEVSSPLAAFSRACYLTPLTSCTKVISGTTAAGIKRNWQEHMLCGRCWKQVRGEDGRKGKAGALTQKICPLCATVCNGFVQCGQHSRTVHGTVHVCKTFVILIRSNIYFSILTWWTAWLRNKQIVLWKTKQLWYVGIRSITIDLSQLKTRKVIFFFSFFSILLRRN